LQDDIFYYLEKYSKKIIFIQENYNNFELIMAELENFDLDDFEKNSLIKILVACFLDQLRFSLAKTYVIAPLNEQMRLEKIKAWIDSHLEYFKLVYITIENLKHIILSNKSLLEQELIHTNLAKYIKN
ncbi:hypothetical protein CL163727_CL163727_000535, partial [Campylobacter lari]